MPKIAGDVNTARSYASAALTEAEKGQKISKEMQDDYISTEHLLLGLASVGKPATFKQFLKNLNLRRKNYKTLDSLRVGKSGIENSGEFAFALKKYGRLVEQASQENWILLSAVILKFAGLFESFQERPRIIPFLLVNQE